jgi:hypothetical protein
MNEIIHKDLAQGRWFTFSIDEQLANVGSEFSRASAAWQSGNMARFEKAFDRMLDLLDLTISDPRWRKRAVSRSYYACEKRSVMSSTVTTRMGPASKR